MTYDVFISYARDDYADNNKQVIPNNAISRIKALFDEHNITYWFDEEGVFSGDAFAPMIARNIKASKIFLFISTERSNSSEWTSNEIATAHTYRKKIIPFRYDDSVYNDSVIIYIARLDYIDYQANPEKAFDRLLHSVQSYLQAEREKAEREQQEEARRREAEISRKERAAKLQSLRERIEHLENRKFEIEKEILTQEKTLTDLRNEKRIVEANISDLQEEEALLLGHTRPKQPVVETPRRVEPAKKRKEPVAESGERKGLFAREWADLKAAMAQKHWLVNTIQLLGVVIALGAWFVFFSIANCEGFRNLYDFGSPIVAFTAFVGCYQLLKNRRDGWYWMLFGSVMGVLFIDAYPVARIGYCIISSLVCGVFALAMLIRKHGKSAWSHLQRNTLPIKRDKIYLSQIVVAGLFLLLCLGNWIDAAMLKSDVERRFENGATWSELRDDAGKVRCRHPFNQRDWRVSLEERSKACEAAEKAKRERQLQLQLQELKAAGADGKINGYYYVDLGLSVKWATCNVGASSPSEYGNYYAWGETSTKSTYFEKNSKTYNHSMGDIVGNPNYDAACANWGGSWRLPTKAEFQELIDKCTWTWTSQGGHNGYKVTGKNGNSIFLPAAGYYNEASRNNAEEGGYYWSSTTKGSLENACMLFIDRDEFRMGDGWFRYRGRPVRPVSE